MDTKELKNFLQVYEDRSITKAAKSLFITPQGLSKSIKSLEDELSVALFYRTPRGIIPTEHGIALKQKAHHIMTEMEAIQLDFDNLTKCAKGKIDVACAYGILSALSPDCIFEFKKANPWIDLSVVEYTDKFAEEAVWRGDADLGMTIGPIDEHHFDYRLLKKFQAMLLVSKTHRLADRKAIDFADLRDEVFVLESREFKINHNTIKHCREAGFEPKILFETTEISLSHKLCSQEKGITVTVDFVAQDIVLENVVAIPFKNNFFTWDVYMITKKDNINMKVADIFKKHVENWVCTNIDPIK